MREYPGRLFHHTPGWVKNSARFHLRLQMEPEQRPMLTDPELALGLLAAAQRSHADGHWWCELFLLMPDHLHAVLTVPAEPGMSEPVRNWKRGTALLQRVRWQDGYFDHRLRNLRESRETWDYIRFNPVVKKLCASADEWPWWWSALVENPLLPVRLERGGPDDLAALK